MLTPLIFLGVIYFLEDALLLYNILEKSTQAYSKLTLVIRTSFRISKSFSLFHKLFMKVNTHLVGAVVTGRLRKKFHHFKCI
jgi:hypothetical protein